MFGVGSWEMVVIAVVAMLLFSPKELPAMLRSVARFWGQLRATADEFKDAIMTADGVDELQEMVRGTHAQIRTVEDEARREMMKARAQMRKAQQKLAMTNKAKQERRRTEQDGKAGEPSPGPTPAAPPIAAEPAQAEPAQAEPAQAEPGPGPIPPPPPVSSPTPAGGGSPGRPNNVNQGAA